MGPFKPYFAENICLQSSNCSILGLAATVPFFANEARFTQIKVFCRVCSLHNEVSDPILYLYSTETAFTQHKQDKYSLQTKGQMPADKRF